MNTGLSWVSGWWVYTWVSENRETGSPSPMLNCHLVSFVSCSEWGDGALGISWSPSSHIKIKGRTLSLPWAMVLPVRRRIDSPFNGMASISLRSNGIGSPSRGLPSQGENSTISLLVSFFPNLLSWHRCNMHEQMQVLKVESEANNINKINDLCLTWGRKSDIPRAPSEWRLWRCPSTAIPCAMGTSRRPRQAWWGGLRRATAWYRSVCQSVRNSGCLGPQTAAPFRILAACWCGKHRDVCQRTRLNIKGDKAENVDG